MPLLPVPSILHPFLQQMNTLRRKSNIAHFYNGSLFRLDWMLRSERKLLALLGLHQYLLYFSPIALAAARRLFSYDTDSTSFQIFSMESTALVLNGPL